MPKTCPTVAKLVLSLSCQVDKNVISSWASTAVCGLETIYLLWTFGLSINSAFLPEMLTISEAATFSGSNRSCKYEKNPPNQMKNLIKLKNIKICVFQSG